MRQRYATILGKDELKTFCRITDVTADGRVFRDGKECKQYLNSSGHLVVSVYDRVRRSCTPMEKRKNYTGNRVIPVHRLVYAWFHNYVPEGMVVDHINNIKTDNRIENLQLLTPSENIWKDRAANTKEKKCKLNKPKSYYESKLRHFTNQYEKAKKEHDAINAHKYRSYISQYKARLRYYDNHKGEEI